ncbi:Immunoglobulin A1 protease autotransporter [Burkholderia sp. AD24]|nr:Immunoglobulin A1 protease autotransporter [Burkholderia sp. AD24]
MLSDITSDQQDYPRCGHCGEPLSGRFTRCPSCHAHPVDTLDARPVPPPSLKIPLDPPPSTIDARLPARRIWRPSSRALVNPYDVVEEPVVDAPPHQRLRQSLVISGSVLVVASAVYLGFIHSNDSGVGPPIEVSGKVKTQNVVPPIAVVQHPAAPTTNRSAAAAAQRSTTVATQHAPPVVTAQRPSSTASTSTTATTTATTQRPTIVASQHGSQLTAQHAATETTQRPAIVASQRSPAVTSQRPTTETTQRPAVVTAQRAPAANTQRSTAANEQRPTIAATQRTPATATTTPRPTVIASQRAAAVRLPPLPPANPPLPAPRRVAAAAPDTMRTASNTSNSGSNAPDKSRTDVSRHIKAARFDLQQNNLSATRARLAAAIAVQPDNRDVLNMRSTLNTREQQRDALLSLARSCGTIARWTCVRHSAGSALQIDSSSKEAQRLVMLAAREAEPAFTLPAPSVPDSVPDPQLDNHH